MNRVGDGPGVALTMAKPLLSRDSFARHGARNCVPPGAEPAALHRQDRLRQLALTSPTDAPMDSDSGSIPHPPGRQRMDALRTPTAPNDHHASVGAAAAAKAQSARGDHGKR